MLSAGSGCAGNPAPSPATLPAGTTDTIWYISARGKDGRRERTRPAPTLAYGFVVLDRGGRGVPPGGSPPSAVIDSVQLTEESFGQLIAERLRDAPAPDDYAVLYVHGFGTSLREAWVHTATARHRAGARAPWIVFCWPSRGSGIGPPRRGALLTSAYHDDSAAAAASIPSFVTATRRILADLSPARTVLLAHSLGGQIVGEGLASDDSLQRALRTAPLRAIAFAAPDIDAARFADSLVPALRPLTQRLVLYASQRDRVLRVSGRIHGSDRAGRRNARAILRAGLETVDASRAWTNEGWFMRTVGTHHAIKRANGILFDLGFIVARQRSPMCRVTLGIGSLTTEGEWRLTSAPPRISDQGSTSCDALQPALIR
ncbi:MAG: alpha/beta hydrolase [Gemmatimonadaceae bacterium]|nr:alpha/beta hydrolase [Gemmatimonadaceae bacterium]